jgi:hypothetical protein
MFCSHCGAPLNPSGQSCSVCGASVILPLDAPVPQEATSTRPSGLTSESRLVMVYQGSLGRVEFGFQDPSGRPLGATRGEIVFPLKYTVLDEQQQVVLILDGERVRGLLYDFLVHEPNGGVLASFRQKSSFMSRKYGVTVNGEERMTLTTDATGYHYQLVENGTEAVVVTGTRTSGLRKSFVEIAFADGSAGDHRIGIGAMLLVYDLCTRRVA